MPELIQISVGNHPGVTGERPFNRMSFTFMTAFPSYRFEFASKLVGGPSGKAIPIAGRGVERATASGQHRYTVAIDAEHRRDRRRRQHPRLERRDAAAGSNDPVCQDIRTCNGCGRPAYGEIEGW